MQPRTHLIGRTLACLLAAATLAAAQEAKTGSVIFIHPDGTSAASWAAARAYYVGPDKQLNWDKLPAMAVYTGHMADSLTATSNGGATTHAYGVKVASNAYGTWGGTQHAPIVDAEGKSTSIARQAIAAGLPVGLVQTGIATEPGTGCFLASAPSRSMHDQIAAQLIASGADVLLSGGERYFLPEGTAGRHGPGVRKDDRNLVHEAIKAGYTIVYNRAELNALPADTRRVLGLFAAGHTFNDKTEETLAREGLPLYQPDAPTVAEMTAAALRILEAKDQRFLLIVEEEGTDNFGNKNNARGMLEAMRRADAAIGVIRAYIAGRPDTLVLNAADSDAGGMRMVGWAVNSPADIPARLPAADENGAPIDGVDGTGTAPFLAQPDQFGRRLPFAICWANHDDVSGGILVRAEGLNSERVSGVMDNTELPKLMHLTLFGKPGPAPVPAR